MKSGPIDFSIYMPCNFRRKFLQFVNVDIFRIGQGRDLGLGQSGRLQEKWRPLQPIWSHMLPWRQLYPSFGTYVPKGKGLFHFDTFGAKKAFCHLRCQKGGPLMDAHSRCTPPRCSVPRPGAMFCNVPRRFHLWRGLQVWGQERPGEMPTILRLLHCGFVASTDN